MYYANEESDDVMSGSIKTVHQHSIKNISRGIKTVFLKTLTPDMFITNETRWHSSCHCHGNSYTAGTVVIKTKIVRFYRELESSTPNNLMGRVKTMNHVCCEQDPLSHLKRLQWGYFVFFTERDWSQECCHGNNILGGIQFYVMCIFSGPKFKKHCINIFWWCSWFSIILLFKWNYFWHHHFLICMVQKRKYLCSVEQKTKTPFTKEESYLF